MARAVRISRTGRLALRALGGLFFLVGLAGIVLPLLPTVVFWILAALCWARSAPDWHRRLTAHPRYGAPIAGFLDHGVVPRQAKGYALTAIVLSGAVSSLALAGPTWLLLSLWVVLAAVSVWILSRPEPDATLTTGRDRAARRREG